MQHLKKVHRMSCSSKSLLSTRLRAAQRLLAQTQEEKRSQRHCRPRSHRPKNRGQFRLANGRDRSRKRFPASPGQRPRQQQTEKCCGVRYCNRLSTRTTCRAGLKTSAQRHRGPDGVVEQEGFHFRLANGRNRSQDRFLPSPDKSPRKRPCKGCGLMQCNPSRGRTSRRARDRSYSPRNRQAARCHQLKRVPVSPGQKLRRKPTRIPNFAWTKTKTGDYRVLRNDTLER